MTTRTPPTPPPTERLLGPWSTTALAALLVVGGILVLIPGKANVDDADDSASSLHPQLRVPAILARPQAPATTEQKPASVAVQGSSTFVAGSGADSELLTSGEHQGAGSRLTTPNQ